MIGQFMSNCLIIGHCMSNCQKTELVKITVHIELSDGLTVCVQLSYDWTVDVQLSVEGWEPMFFIRAFGLSQDLRFGMTNNLYVLFDNVL